MKLIIPVKLPSPYDEIEKSLTIEIFIPETFYQDSDVEDYNYVFRKTSEDTTNLVIYLKYTSTDRVHFIIPPEIFTVIGNLKAGVSGCKLHGDISIIE